MSMPTPDSAALMALRYTFNDREWRLLHDYVIKKAPASAQRHTYTPDEYCKACDSRGDYHAATTRSALRVFLTVGAGLTGWDVISTKLLQRGAAPPAKPKTSLIRSPNFRLALSLSSILYFHRILHRLFLRLRLRLLAEKAGELRKRYPLFAKALTSRFAPAIGASLAGFALGIYRSDQLRLTMTIYVAARALEFLYNAIEAEGYLKNKPDWIGSWLLFPLAQGQLFHAFVFDRDCLPKAYGDFLLKHTPNYIQKRPATVSPSVPWPGTYEIVDSLAEMARLNWPTFISPILLPKNPTPLPPSISSKISSITSSAHPLLHGHPLSCAVLHPNNPSCLHALLTHMLLSTPSLLRVFTIILSLCSLPRYKSLLDHPLPFLNSLSKAILKTTFIISSAIGVSWSSICLFQQFLPRSMIPQWRFFLGGFLGGSFAWFGRNSGGRSNALYAARVSADSLWKVGVKRRWWRPVKGGDLLVFVTSMAILGGVMEINKEALGKGWERATMNVLQGESEIGLNVKEEEEVADEPKDGETGSDPDPAGEGEWEKVTGKEQSDQ